jgi:hypothetical protein
VNRFAGIVGSVLVAAGLAMAPLAHADAENTQAFVDEMHAAGFSGVGSDSFLVINAWKMCAAMDQGATPAKVAEELGAARSDLTPEDSGKVIVLAILHFCPSHMPDAERAAKAPAEVPAETTA